MRSLQSYRLAHQLLDLPQRGGSILGPIRASHVDLVSSLHQLEDLLLELARQHLPSHLLPVLLPYFTAHSLNLNKLLLEGSLDLNQFPSDLLLLRSLYLGKMPFVLPKGLVDDPDNSFLVGFGVFLQLPEHVFVEALQLIVDVVNLLSDHIRKVL